MLDCITVDERKLRVRVSALTSEVSSKGQQHEHKLTLASGATHDYYDKCQLGMAKMREKECARKRRKEIESNNMTGKVHSDNRC